MNYLDAPGIKPYFPKQPNGLAIVGDMPRDASNKLPFMESFYGSLSGICRSADIDLKNCFQTNALGFLPPEGKWSLALPDQIEVGKQYVIAALADYQPKAILFLGTRTAQCFKPGFEVDKVNKKTGVPVKKGKALEKERGAPFMWNGVPAICTFHPRDIFVQYHLNAITVNDFVKAKKYATFGWAPPEFNLIWDPTFEQCCQYLDLFAEKKPYLSVDIETHMVTKKITCIGFAWSALEAITVPFSKPNGARLWSHEQEKILWKKCAIVLETCKLLGHNALHFDHQVLAQYHNILPNFVGDTMFAHWECYPEMLKSLGFCSSLYTDYPYWKDVLKDARSGKIDYREEFKYNGKDSCTCMKCAFEIRKEMDELPPGVRSHYEFNIRVSRAFQYMSIRGVRLDKEKLSYRLNELQTEAKVLQEEFSSLVGYELNVRSPKKFKNWLYNELKLPIQYKTSKNESGDYEEKESGDYLSLLYLARSFPHLPAVLSSARLRKLLKRISSLSAIQSDPKGFIYWNFGLVSTETGRAAGYKPLNGLGVQPQNVDSRDRDLFCADVGGLWFKADLEGADSWTVAAQCAALGDPTMMNDLLGGVKPAQALAIAHLFGHHLITEKTDVLASYKKAMKEKCNEQDAVRGKKRNDYEVMKAVSHGGNYGMKKQTMHTNIFKKSEGELFILPDDCEVFQDLYFRRYPGLLKLHEEMVRIMNEYGFLDSYGGTRRMFFGRRDSGTVRDMLSHLPQAHTSYVTNKFIERIYYWQRNRSPEKRQRLIIEPVNQVHDETCFVIREGGPEALAFVRDFCKDATHIPVECWKQPFIIPFEIQYGPDWGSCKETL